MYITHDQAEAFALADQAGVLEGGRLVMIRPTGVRQFADGSDGHHLSGRVTGVALGGHGYEHAIGINDGTRLAGSSPARGARP